MCSGMTFFRSTALGMGGANCAVFGCHASNGRCPGLSFFHIRSLGGSKCMDSHVLEWRKQLLNACKRAAPFNPSTAHICSRHFEENCLEVTGKCHSFVSNLIIYQYMYITALMFYKGQRRRLKLFSLPTKYLPLTSVSASNSTSIARKPPV